MVEYGTKEFPFKSISNALNYALNINKGVIINILDKSDYGSIQVNTNIQINANGSSFNLTVNNCCVDILKANIGTLTVNSANLSLNSCVIENANISNSYGILQSNTITTLTNNKSTILLYSGTTTICNNSGAILMRKRSNRLSENPNTSAGLIVGSINTNVSDFGFTVDNINGVEYILLNIANAIVPLRMYPGTQTITFSTSEFMVSISLNLVQNDNSITVNFNDGFRVSKSGTFESITASTYLPKSYLID